MGIILKDGVKVVTNYKLTILPKKLIETYKKYLGDRENYEEIISIAVRLLGVDSLKQLGCRVWEGHNLVPNIFKNELADLISGTTISYSLKANYIALGSNATVVANTDTKLGTETIRSTFTNRESADNIVYLDKYFDAFQVGGNAYKEIGVFIDGTASVDSGLLLSHINIDEDLASDETIIVNLTISIT